jgi:hypothetical protein
VVAHAGAVRCMCALQGLRYASAMTTCRACALLAGLTTAVANVLHARAGLACAATTVGISGDWEARRVALIDYPEPFSTCACVNPECQSPSVYLVRGVKRSKVVACSICGQQRARDPAAATKEVTACLIEAMHSSSTHHTSPNKPMEARGDATQALKLSSDVMRGFNFRPSTQKMCSRVNVQKS